LVCLVVVFTVFTVLVVLAGLYGFLPLVAFFFFGEGVLVGLFFAFLTFFAPPVRDALNIEVSATTPPSYGSALP